VIAFTLVAALGAAACGSDDNGGGSSGGGDIEKMVWAIQSPVQSMDPAIMADVPTLRAQSAAFDRVLSIDNNGVVQPWIASKFDMSDPLKLVLTIRSDVKFWDGTPMTVDDVVYSIARHVGPDSKSVQAMNFSAVGSVEATDASTITITLTTPDPGLPAKLSVWAQVRQRAYDTAAGEAAGGPDKPGLGTGPYKIVSYSSADGVKLVRNDAYWAGKPKVKELEFKAIGDPDTARLALSSGEIDGFFDVPLIATRQLDQLDNATMTYVPGAYNDFLSMNVTRAPFDDVNARIAVGHLIDRASLLGPLFNDRATVAQSIVPAIQMPSTFGTDGATSLYKAIGTLPDFSIDKAKEALAKSATPDGFSVDLAVDTSQPWMSPLAQHLAENAKKVGITINVKQVSAADWGAGLMDPAGSPLQLVALGAATPWAGELPPVVLGSKAVFPLAAYGGDDVDALADSVASAGTVDALRTPLQDLLTKVTADLPYLPLFDEQVATALSKKFVWEGGYSYYALSQAWPLQLGGAG
jgi:peptide/nickel transport system substrate-binding protein